MTTTSTTPAPSSQQSAASRRARLSLGAALPYAIAVVAAFAVVAVLIVALGHDPIQAFRAVLTNSFRNQTGVVQTLQKWVPLTLLALAFVIPLAAGRFNIGGEGQMILGATGAVAVGIVGSGLPAAVLLPLVVLAGVLAGALWAAVSAWLMDRFSVNEILSTVLLNFVSFELLDYIASSVWSDAGAGGAVTIPIAAAAELPTVGRPPMHIGVILVAFLAAGAAVLARRSTAGYELRAVGFSPDAAHYGGIRPRGQVMLAMVISGALAGLVGINELAGVQHRLLLDFVVGAGFTGIAVSLIGRNHPVGIVLAALLFGALFQGGAELAFEIPGFSRDMVTTLQGLIVLFSGAMAQVAAPGLARVYGWLRPRPAAVATGVSGG